MRLARYVGAITGLSNAALPTRPAPNIEETLFFCGFSTPTPLAIEGGGLGQKLAQIFASLEEKLTPVVAPLFKQYCYGLIAATGATYITCNILALIAQQNGSPNPFTSSKACSQITRWHITHFGVRAPSHADQENAQKIGLLVSKVPSAIARVPRTVMVR